MEICDDDHIHWELLRQGKPERDKVDLTPLRTKQHLALVSLVSPTFKRVRGLCLSPVMRNIRSLQRIEHERYVHIMPSPVRFYYCLCSFPRHIKGSLQYVVVDFVQFMLGVPNFEQLPHLDFAPDPHKMLQPRLVIFDAHMVFLRRGRDASACQYFYDAWEAAIMSLGSARANLVEADGGTVLGRMLALLQEALTLEWQWNPFWDPDIDGPAGQQFDLDFREISEHAIVTTVIRFVTEKLQVQTVEQIFRPHQDELKSLLWRFVQDKLSLPRGAGHHPAWLEGGHRPGLSEGRGATLMLVLIEKGLPRWYWGGCHGFASCGGNLLQYILESTCRPFPFDHTEAEGFLCLALAERYTLEEFFHQTAASCITLGYAKDITDRITARRESGGYLGESDLRVWFEVDTKIREQMQSRARDFQGSLLEFAALTGSVRAALRGD